MVRTLNVFLSVVLTTGLVMVAAAGITFGMPGSEDPQTLFLTWQSDPTTTMIVQWLADASDPVKPTVMFKSLGASSWETQSGGCHPFPLSDWSVCRVELTGLKPGTEYVFRLSGNPREYRFDTAPAVCDKPVIFVSGGDIGIDRQVADIHARAAACDPLFALVGGDIAYANNADPKSWRVFLEMWNQYMVTNGGRLIPLVVTIGNHEVSEGATTRGRDDAAMFYSLFGLFGQAGYATLDFGNYLTLVLLDTDHTTPIAGPQTDWLKQALAQRNGIPNCVVCYHRPAYPSLRPFDNQHSTAIRRQWVPLFEKYHVDVVFEHHEHTYKRTHPILNGAVNPDGIVYIGDGAWGRYRPKVKSPKQRWYLEKSANARHFIRTVVSSSGMNHTVINDKGRVIDAWPSIYPPSDDSPRHQRSARNDADVVRSSTISKIPRSDTTYYIKYP